MVVIAGRPNVGKSTLVNRIVGRRVAVTEEKPGVTRDRLELEAEWAGKAFVIVDTGGWIDKGVDTRREGHGTGGEGDRRRDVVLLVVDASVGVTTEDEPWRRLLRREATVIVVANKVDNERRENEAWEFVSLGLGDPLMVSALHGRGSGDLLDEVVSRLPAQRRGAGAEEHAAIGGSPRSDSSTEDSTEEPEDDGRTSSRSKPARSRSSGGRMSESRLCSTG